MPSAGYRVPSVTRVSTRRWKRVDELMTKVNVYIYYEIDEDEVKTSLRADEYDGDCEGS